MFPAVPLLAAEFPEAVEPGVLADEGVDPALPGKVPQLFAVPLGGFVAPGVDVVLPGAPGVTVFGEPGLVLLGLVVPWVVVLGVVVLGVVVPGVLGVVLCGVVVPAGGVAVSAGGVAVPGVGEVVVPGVPAGGVVEPGVELCPAVPVPPAGAVPPPADELCATTQLPQHKITESNVSLVIDISTSKGFVRSLRSSLPVGVQYRNLTDPHAIQLML